MRSDLNLDFHCNDFTVCVCVFGCVSIVFLREHVLLPECAFVYVCVNAGAQRILKPCHTPPLDSVPN